MKQRILTNKIPNDIVYISHVLLSDLYDAVLYKDNALQYLLDEVYRITDIQNVGKEVLELLEEEKVLLKKNSNNFEDSKNIGLIN